MTKVYDQCPECGTKDIVFEAGCNHCLNCFWSSCSID